MPSIDMTRSASAHHVVAPQAGSDAASCTALASTPAITSVRRVRRVPTV